jgi:hypothetical protein
MDRPVHHHLRQRGQALYISGPYDDVRHVTKTLDRTIGSGNYHFIVGGPVNA